jgi:mannosyltransferase OCH1-like enzyme
MLILVTFCKNKKSAPMNHHSFTTFFFLLLLPFSIFPQPWQQYEFDDAMQKGSFLEVLASTTQSPDQTLKKIGVSAQELFDFFKKLYDKHNPTQIQADSTVKIPKIIHQIWLGSPVPECFKAFMKSWELHHPGWTYILWTDEKVKTLTLYNQDLFDAATNFGEKADILRYELLYFFGGVYADCDQECLRSLDFLHHLYDFYIGI